MCIGYLLLSCLFALLYPIRTVQTVPTADEYCLYDDKVDRLWSGTEDGIVTTAGMIRPETKADTVSVAGCVWNGGVETGEPQRYVREI